MGSRMNCQECDDPKIVTISAIGKPDFNYCKKHLNDYFDKEKELWKK